MGFFGSLYRFATAPFSKGALPPHKKAEARRILTDEVMTDYRPQSAALPGLIEQSSSTPELGRVLADVEAMLAHPRVHHAFSYYKAGIAGATFTVEDASSPQVADFALSELSRFWRTCRRPAQRSYDYGRGAGELVYSTADGALRLERLQPFMPLDARVLLRGGVYAGVRVAGGGQGPSGQARRVDLWGASPDAGGLPAKGWWHAHDPRYSRWYGWPQPYAAWRPWRRLAGRDGAEDIVDGGVYRFAFAPPIGRFPPEDQLPREEGGVVWTNRDKMRQLLETLKAGGVVALSGRKDDKGDYVWQVQWPEGSLDVTGLLAYTDSLEKAISLGCGVPPELLEASEVGSGYSGRAIPLEAFYIQQQGNAEDLVASWYYQIGLPLLVWNFGPGSWCRLRVNDLLKERMKATQGAQPQQGGPEKVPAQARFATGQRAPAGGVSIGGTDYAGGQFVPGEVIERATPEERAKLEGGGGHSPRRASYEKAHGEWTARQKARDERRTTLGARSGALLAMGRAEIALIDASRANDPAGWASVAGEMLSAAKATGMDEKGAMRLATARERGTAKIARPAEKMARARAALEEVTKARGELGPEPVEPDAPDDADYFAASNAMNTDDPGFDAQMEKDQAAYDAADARFEKEHAAWERTHDRWSSRMERLQEKEEKASEQIGEAEAELSEAIGAATEALDLVATELREAAEEALAAEEEALDAEEAADEEPDEPDEPDDEDEEA